MSAQGLSDRFFRDVHTLTGDVFWAFSVSQGTVEYISDNVVGLLGYPAEDLQGGSLDFLRAIIDPRDRPEMIQAVAASSDDPGYLEVRYVHQQGHAVFAQIWLRRRPDDEDIVEGLTREVTTLHRLESALRESEERFGNAMRSTAVSMCLVSPAGQFVEVNTALCALLERDEQTLRNTTWQTLTHPDDLHVDVALVDDVLAGRRDSYRLRKRFLRPDATVVWGDMSVSCVRDEDGRVRHFVTQIVDVTAQMDIEQKLRASEEEYRLLVEESSDFLLRTRGDSGIIAWVSPSMTRVLGWRPEDVVGRSALDFLHPDDHPRAQASRMRMDAGEQVSGRQRLLRSDGTYLWMSQVGRTILDDKGAAIARISSFQDIDAQVHAEQALAASEAAARADRERLRATMDAMVDPLFVIEPVRDAAGKIIDFRHVDVNMAGLAHAGFTWDEFIGSRLLELVPGQQVVIDRYIEAFEKDEPLIADAMAFGDPQGVGPDRLFDVRAVRVGQTLSVTIRDVTQRVEAADALAESQARYRLLAENASDVVYRIHVDGTIQWLSEGVQRILGQPADAFLGRHIDDFVHAPDQELLDAAVEEALIAGRTTVRFRVQNPAGDLHWLEASMLPVLSDDETILVGGCRDVHTEMVAMAELDRRARTDHLTGLPNRDEALARLRMLLVKDRPSPTAVAFCDLDNFKAINDTYGHAEGDQWLRQASDRIRARLREGDLVARMGGDELLVVLPGVHNLDRAVKVCESLRKAMQSGEARSTVSIGVTLGWPGDEAEAVVARADVAMYRAKQAGRNTVVGI